MPSDGNGIRARADSAVDGVTEPLTSVSGGSGLTLFALGIGSTVLTFPAISLTQATLVAVGGWLTARTITASTDSPNRSSAPSFGTCIDCGRTVVTDADGPVRCVDCADLVTARPGTAATRQSADAETEGPRTGRDSGGTDTELERTEDRAVDASGAAENGGPPPDSADTAAESAMGDDVEAGSATGNGDVEDVTNDPEAEDTTGNGDGQAATNDVETEDVSSDADTEEDGEEPVQKCVRCGATDVPLDRVRLLDGEDYDYCPDCRAEAEASDVVHTVAMTPEEAYAVLGVSPDDDDATVRAAFRERIKAVHPDLDGDRDEFDRVRAAYERIRE